MGIRSAVFMLLVVNCEGLYIDLYFLPFHQTETGIIMKDMRLS